MPYWVEYERKRESLVEGDAPPSYLSSREMVPFVQEFRRQIGAIDSELSQLILDWRPYLSSLLTFFTSIAAYPSRKKIEQLKSVLRSPDKHSDDACRTITRILLGRVPYAIYLYRAVRSDGPIQVTGMPAPQKLGEYEQEATNDPDDPDAPMLPLSLVSAELERRRQWKKKWEEYLTFLKRRYSDLFTYDLKFDSDLPTIPYGSIRISPRLRLPTGEYLEPVVGTDTTLPAGPTTPVTDDTTVPVSEDKKDEKKAFPWWVVIVVGVVALLFFTKG